ncbi:MAG: thiamine phosphate synthase [Thermodesulfobacteriota bacterium]
MESQLYQRRLKQFVEEVTVYPVSCDKLSNGRGDRQWLDEVLKGGARVVQLRDKESGDRELLAKARYFREKTREANVLFFLNDRLDIALLADADGMHVGQKDLPPEAIRKLAPEMIIGLSCNSHEHAAALGREVAAGSSPVSYFNIGPLYSTKTKDGLQSFLGPQAITEFSNLCPLPFTVMGGIKLEHVAEVTSMGGRRIAVVTAISQAGDMAEATRLWNAAITAQLEGGTVK